MLIRNIRYRLLLAAFTAALLSQPCWAVRMIYEAEDAYDATGVHKFGDTIDGFSGSGYMLMLGTGTDGLDFTVTTMEAGSYPLTIRYHDPYGDKQTELWVNGTRKATLSVPGGTSGWTDLVFGDISLNAGENIVRLENGWTYIYFDYIALDGFPLTATDPIPGIHETVNVNLPQLCWTNPDPNSPGIEITSDVYLGTTVPDRNQSDYGLTQIASGTADTCVDVPFTLDPFETYYWVVDCWDPNTGGNPVLIRGYSWDFNTNNSAPEADAGEDQYVGLGNDGDPQSATVILNGTGTSDDGLPSNTMNYLWQQLAGPAGVVIYPYDTPSTTVTLSVTGTYEFSLTADDTFLDSTDTVIINVYESECEVYKAQDGTLDLGDITEDCIVDIEDLVALVRYWLECNSAGPCVE